MKTIIVLCILVMITFASMPVRIDHVDGEPLPRRPGTPLSDRVFIDYVGDIRAVLGGQGKSIAVSQNGEAIAVIFGARSDNPDYDDPWNNMEACVAYSVDGGVTWTLYGPLGTPPCRRMYNGVVGTPNFHVNPGELFFIWQENTRGYEDGELNVMIEENVPSSPSFSVPVILPNSQPRAMYPWEPDIDWDRDNPQNLVATGWSYLAYGNEWAYAWVSHDGGYTWSDSIPMAFISQDGAPGNLSFGTGGYVVYTYHDYRNLGGNDSVPTPHFIESTDGGYTWSSPVDLTIVPANINSQFWWHEMDCLVINDEPWFVHNDIGTPGGGPYVVKGIGSPGNWAWSIWNVDSIGYDSTWYAGGLWYCAPSQYPSLAYNPTNGMILVTYKANIVIGDSSMYNGAHIQGIYTTNNGINWTITDPLSAPNNGAIYWGDWSATETAHHLVQDGYYSKAHSVWIDGTALVLYSECEYVTEWGWIWVNAVDSESDLFNKMKFNVSSSIVQNSCRLKFTMLNLSYATIKIYDVTGQLISIPFAGNLKKGMHERYIDTSQLSNGTYFVLLETESNQEAQKIVVAR